MSLMSQARINHMEVTVARGTLESMMHDLKTFYCDTLGLVAAQLGEFPAPHLFLNSDDFKSFFIYVAEHEQPMIVAGDDHLGFHMQDAGAVNRLLDACRSRAQVDQRMQIRELDDLDLDQTRTHAFYFRYLLPIWFDIQHIEFKRVS